MNDVVAHFKKLNGAKGWGEWEVDQVLFVSFFVFLSYLIFFFFFAKCIKSHPLCQNSKVAVSLTDCHFRIQSAEGQDRTGWDRAAKNFSQVILSHAILRPDRQLCSLPKSNKLWSRSETKMDVNGTNLTR